MTLSNSIKKYMKATGIGNKELSEKSGVPLKAESKIMDTLMEGIHKTDSGSKWIRHVSDQSLGVSE